MFGVFKTAKKLTKIQNGIENITQYLISDLESYEKNGKIPKWNGNNVQRVLEIVIFIYAYTLYIGSKSGFLTPKEASLLGQQLGDITKKAKEGAGIVRDQNYALDVLQGIAAWHEKGETTKILQHISKNIFGITSYPNDNEQFIIGEFFGKTRDLVTDLLKSS